MTVESVALSRSDFPVGWRLPSSTPKLPSGIMSTATIGATVDRTHGHE